MSTRRRASAGSSSESGLPMYVETGSEEDKDADAGQHDRAELDDPEYFESLNGNGIVEDDGVDDGKVLDTKSARARWYRIYVLHLLFMWNLRTYEYASIVLVSTAFPDNLAPAAIRGIASTVPAMFFSSAVGNWIDRSQSRLRPMLTSIYLSHGAITLSYLVWLLWPIVPSDGYADEESEPHVTAWTVSKVLLFSVIVLLDVVHDMSSIANRVSLERDWVPVLVGPITPQVTYGLTQVNAVMKRLDLASKLVAPSILPLIIAVFNFREGWILLLATSTIVFLIIQIRSAHIAAREHPELLASKKPSSGIAADHDYDFEGHQGLHKSGFRSWPLRIYASIYKNPVVRLKHYFSMPIWPASIAEALAQMTVLAYSSTLVTYLLEVGFPLSVVTVARASGTIMALASTVIAPIAVNFIRKRKIRQSSDRNPSGDEIEGDVVRSIGTWGILSQVLCMIPVVLVLWHLSLNLNPSSPETRDDTTDPSSSMPSPNFLLSFTLFAFLSLSRIGHLLFELMVQEIAQVEIPSTQRSTFAGTEQSFRSLAELCHWIATVVWNAPRDFRFLAVGSFVALVFSTAIFARWARKPRVGVRIDYEEIPLEEIDPHAD